MNFKFVKQKIIMATVVGTICFCRQTVTSEATDIEYPPTRVIEYSAVSFATVEGYAYVRDAPDIAGNWIGKLYNDNKVTIHSIEGSWAHIESGSVQGYVEVQYLLDSQSSLIREQEVGIHWAIVQATALNVRMGPGTEYEIKDTVPNNFELQIIGTAINGWQAVQYGENICFVSTQYIIEETRFTYAEPYVEIIAEEVISPIIAGGNIVEFAMQFIGNPYVWGGTDLTNGADCSGFVQSVYKNFGIELPRTSGEQRGAGTEVSYENIQLGDIVCYDGHVGIYAGEGQIVNAINSEKGIGMSSATYSNILSIRRVI